MIKQLRDFLALEASAGVILLGVAALAMLAANSFIAPYYATISSPPVKFFINDVLMAIFFLLVGLEIRAEMEHGTLSTLKQAALPLVAALGGVITPALIYLYYTHGSAAAHGWAIASATDIAFSLGILALAGSRAPEALKIFLMAVAVIDDMAAVLIIALFYTAHLSLISLIGACYSVGILWYMRRINYEKLWVYLANGAVLWLFIFSSGIHPTIAGVLLGLLLPATFRKALIEKLHAPVALCIIPLFAFANAGISLAGVGHFALSQPVTLGIIMGLLIGKPLGIFGFSFVMVRAKQAQLPVGTNWVQFFGLSCLAGVGFTMSLFIGQLAFASSSQMVYVKLGVMLGSLLAALLGAAIINSATRTKK